MLSVRALKTLSRISNALLLLTTICVIGLSCVAILSQAVRTSPSRSWNRNANAGLIAASYAFVLVSFVFLCLRRRSYVRRRLQNMSSLYRAVPPRDVPKAVYEHITKEQARMSLIAYDLIPKDTVREGWGRPGSRYSGMPLRRTLMQTVQSIDDLAHLVVPSLPKLKPHTRMLHHFRFLLPLFPNDENGFTPLHYYDSAIQIARNSSREPTEAEFEAGIRATNEIFRVLESYRLEMMLGSSSQVNVSIVGNY